MIGRGAAATQHAMAIECTVGAPDFSAHLHDVWYRSILAREVPGALFVAVHWSGALYGTFGQI